MCTLGLFVPFIFSFFLAKDEKMTTMHVYTVQSKRAGNRHSSTKIILVLLENEMNKNAFMMFMMDEWVDKEEYQENCALIMWKEKWQRKNFTL